MISSNGPNAAKSDLKRQLKNFKVRPAIEQAIVKELVPNSSGASAHQDVPDEAPPPSRPNFAASVSSLASERPITPMLDAPADTVEPMYVNTQRELDDIFREMHVYFEGRETEQNWLKREESIIKLRKLLAGNAATDFQESFLGGVRALLDGVIKGVSTLRTSLSKESCTLVQEIARTYGPAMDPMVELLMQTFIKLAAATKKISSQQANTTVDTIIGKVTYTARIMQHVWGACQDKNVQPRTYATGWLKTILVKESRHKHHIEHSGGLDLVEKCIKKGLADANPGVREKMRATYWTFAGIWPARAEAILNGLDPTAQKLLQNDANNPNASRRPEEGGARPGMGLSKSTMGGSKPSLREAMMAQKKALAPRNLPARPGSAMSHFSPTRTVSGSSNVSAVSTATTTGTVRTRPESTLAPGGGGLSGAPMRPTRRRPELASRPATAGPYSVRSHDQPSAEQGSPPQSARPKAAITPKAMGASPKRTAQRPRPGHAATASESSLPTPSRLTAQKAVLSPGGTPKLRPSPVKMAPGPSKIHDDLALVTPSVANSNASSPKALTSPISAKAEETRHLTPTKTVQVYEDPVTEEGRTTPNPEFTGSVLEDKAVNEAAAQVQHPTEENGIITSPPSSPERMKQNVRLLESGIAKVRAQSLDVHGFRKLQSIIRDNKAVFTDDTFKALLTGLFAYLECPLVQLTPEKSQDVKAQILATIRLLRKKLCDNFQPHVSAGLESLLRARAVYDSRTHIVAGLELLADELVALGDASDMALVLSRATADLAADSDDARGRRSLSMGLHVLKELVDTRGGDEPGAFVLSDEELATMAALAARCLDAADSGVRMDAVQLCVALHARVGGARFWAALQGVKDDPKNLITYYIAKRQREVPVPVPAAA